MMKTNFKMLVLAAGIAIAGTASAEMTTGAQSIVSQINPLEAFTVHAKDYAAVVYYTVLENGTYEVITTIAPVAESDVMGSQYRATMAVGQTYSLSLQLDEGDPSATVTGLKFVADSEVLHVTEL